MLRAFLRRNQDTVAYLSSTATAGAGNTNQQQQQQQQHATALVVDGDGLAPSSSTTPPTALQGQGRAFHALLAEAEALGWAYLALGFLHALEESTTGGGLDRGHAIGPVPVPLARAEQAWDFDLVREEVLAEVFGVGAGGNGNGDDDAEQVGQQPLEGWLGPWWAGVLPANGGLRLAEAPFLPWRVLGTRLQEGQSVEAALRVAKRAQLLTLYAAADAWGRKVKAEAEAHGQQGQGLPVAALQHGLAGPFAAQMKLPTADALACLAHWAADQPQGQGADELALAAGLPTSGGASYRRLLWSLAAHHRFAEAAHLLDAAPPADATPLDGCLAVGVLMGLGQWQQAFVRQRLLSAYAPPGPLPASRRLAPLRLLAHRLVEEHRVGWLTALPFNPLEAQHVVATLYQSPLRTRDHALLALLLRRKEFTRAWAAWALLAPDVPDDRGEAQAAKEDLARLVQAVERFIPQEELGAMRRARDALAVGTGNAEDAALLERFANLAPLEEFGEAGVGDGEGRDVAAMAMERQQRRRVLMERERARAPLRSARAGMSAAPLPGRVGVGGGSGFNGGVGALSFSAAAHESPMKRGVSDAGGNVSRGGGGDGGGGGGLRTRRSGGGGGSKLRSPPVALRPGWSSRRDRFGGSAAAVEGGGGGGGGGGRRMEEELI